MNSIQVLIAVDVEAALAAQTLNGHVYLVDNNGPNGSTMEGNEELQTACNPAQTIIWWVTGIDPSSNVSITKFWSTGGNPAVPNVIDPVQEADGTWQSVVSQGTAAGTYQYSVNLDMDGATLSFDPFLVVS